MRALYRLIWRATWRAQLGLIALSAMIAALAPAPLDYQKTIVNGLAELDLDPDAFGLDRLLRLGLEMTGIILLSLALKWALRFRMATLGEGMVRLIRRGVLSAYAGRDARVARGTLVTMLSAEAEDVGRFSGEAIALPALQIGTLLSVTGYLVATQPRLGLLMLLIVLPQSLIVTLTQTSVNRMVGERVRLLRGATDAVGRGDDATAAGAEAEREILSAFDAIYETRRRIFGLKLSTKFALSAIDGLGLVALLLVGGWLVIEGRSDVGTVVAAVTALARVGAPWREALAFFRKASAMRVKAALLHDALDGVIDRPVRARPASEP